jgi:two-component system chemotaxis sensor kinase CheA
VRNAVDHGIEPPAERAARGKLAEATVRVSAELLGDRLVVTVSDDGAGIDVAAVRARLAALGEGVPAADRDVARRLFGGGVSTRRRADAISGRGVGLDAVRAAVQQARGGVDVAWTAGIGTTFTLEVPLTLVTIRALLVRVGAHLAALPTAHVERALLLRAEDVAVVDGHAMVRTGGAPAPLASLARVLGPPLVERPAESARPAVLLRVGGRQLALGVEELVDEREVVVRPITGRGRDTIPHVSGAALLTTGEIALVLDATSVVSAGLGAAGDGEAPGVAAAPTRARRILVVDDSITTRTLEQSVLEAAGYDVLTGVDGADGWRILQERGADLVVADVEMPRMDGLELCRRIRASKRFRELPVVLITALETAEDRARGLEKGADAYLGKSTFDQQALLDTIHELVG